MRVWSDSGSATARSFDVAAVAALLVLAAAVRRQALPTDGLVFDDAWVVVGASKAALADLWAVSTNHPGFTAVLAAWARAVSRRSESFALLAFAAGSATPPAAYLALRATSVRRTIALAGAALLVAAPAHVAYSGRVKPYVFEALVVVILVPLVVRLADRRWSWRLAAAWATALVVVGTGSAFLTVVTGCAALVVALHPSGDRRVRTTALALQGALQVALLALAQRSFAADQVAREWESTYDGYFEQDGGVGGIVRQHLTHLGRLGQEVVTSGLAIGVLVAVAAVAGLAVTSRRGRERVGSRYLLVLLAVAYLGGWARQIPFGPSIGNPAFPGGRASLWLLPSLVFGLAWGAEWTATRAGSARGRVERPVALAALAGALLVVVLGAADTTDYPHRGTRSSWELISPILDDGTKALVMPIGGMSVAAEPGVAVAVDPDPASAQGFVVRFLDPRVEVAGLDGFEGAVTDAERVIIHNARSGFGDADLPALRQRLGELGFRTVLTEERGDVEVEVWERGSIEGEQ